MPAKTNIPTWGPDTPKIVGRIRSATAPLKIVVKTRDAPEVLRRWIAHHAAIVGEGNLVVFDNMSQSPQTLAYYEEIAERVTVARFRGFHNRIHRVHHFEKLYAALRASCEYYAFLDGDEFLAYLDDDLSFAPNETIGDRISGTSIAVYPGTWLDNVAGYGDRFWLGGSGERLVPYLRSGKPIISSAVDVRGMLNHNWQIERDLYGGDMRLNLFVKHLRNLSAAERIASNLLKLYAYQVLKAPTTVETIRTLDPMDFEPGNKRRWIEEIQTLDATGEPEAPADAPFGTGTVRIGPDGTLEATPFQREALATFLAHPQAHFARAMA